VEFRTPAGGPRAAGRAGGGRRGGPPWPAACGRAASGFGRLGQVSSGAGGPQLLDDEAPAGGGLERRLHWLAVELAQEAPEALAVGGANPPPPVWVPTPSKLICSRCTSSPTTIVIGASSAPSLTERAVTALELRGSLTRPAGRIPRHAIYAETRSSSLRPAAASALREPPPWFQASGRIPRYAPPQSGEDQRPRRTSSPLTEGRRYPGAQERPRRPSSCTCSRCSLAEQLSATTVDRYRSGKAREGIIEPPQIDQRLKVLAQILDVAQGYGLERNRVNPARGRRRRLREPKVRRSSVEPE
jgi:hypothetical protein